MTRLRHSRLRRPRVVRRWALGTVVAACMAVGVLVGVMVVPSLVSNATDTAVSTVYKTGKNASDGSVAASADAPGGAKTGTAKPGDQLDWVVNYDNNTADDATVNLKDVLTNAGTYVPGSLKLPPNPNAAGSVTPQYSTNGGTSWSTGAPPAAANGVGMTGTGFPANVQGGKQKSSKFPSPTPQTLATSGGDGYNGVVSADGLRVYAVFHHKMNDTTESPIFCAVILTGAVCPGWPANISSVSTVSGAKLGTTPPAPMKTAFQNGTFIVNNKLFWLQASIDASGPVGVGCLDLATTTSCGFTQLDTNPPFAPATDGTQVGGSGIPASNNGLYYFIDGAGNFVCFNAAAATPAACGKVRATAAVGGGGGANNKVISATFGDRVFATIRPAGASTNSVVCLSATTGALCPSFPVSVPSSTSTAGVFAPLLNAQGTYTGVCLLFATAGTGSFCWSNAGATVANPYPITAGPASGGYAGDVAVYFKTQAFYPTTLNNVGCYDFAKNAACAGFTPPAIAAPYTVRPASTVTSTCLVADGDGKQIVFFDGVTGGACVGTAGPVSMTVTPSGYYCATGATSFKAWGDLTLPGLVTSAYTNSTVSLKDQNNTPIAGFTNVTLAPGGTLSLAAIPKTVTSITATVTVNGVKDATGITNGQIAISWSGDPAQICFSTIAPAQACDAAAKTLTNTANAVTTSASGSDAPNGNTSGPAQFILKAATSQCSLKAEKTASLQSARPGDKVTYTIKLTNTGAQAYNAARFTDDLTDVLTDATYNSDASATSGTVSYASPTLSWTGPLAIGASITLTYSVTVNNPDTGDHSLINTVVSPGSNCATGSTDPLCTPTTKIKVTDVVWRKVDATTAKNILAGAAWTFTPVNAAGKATGAPIVVTDCVAAGASSCTGADIDPVAGLFRLTNLGPGTYQLIETRAPVGFKLDPTPIPVTITASATTVTLADVVNKQNPPPALPLTGGLGTDALTITGGALLVLMLALAGCQILRRRRNA